MLLGESVELEVVRGYLLFFDFDDFNVEIIGFYIVVYGLFFGLELLLLRFLEENSFVFLIYFLFYG